MIFCQELNKGFDSQQLMFQAMKEEKPNLLLLKKSAIKFTDGFDCLLFDEVTDKGVVTKGNEAVLDNPTELKVRVVGNTAKLMDSHRDMHVDGLWKRTLKASSKKMLLQEHKREFDKVIANDAKAYVKTMSWKDLGEDYEGDTEVLLADALVKASRNPLMFDQYKNGWVNNHSVGMQYVDLVLCINSEEKYYKEEKENWDKYYPIMVNKEAADSTGYFWAVLEAKLLEISAVLFGSNHVTPTLENNMKSEQSPSNVYDPSKDIQPINKFYNPNLF